MPRPVIPFLRLDLRRAGLAVLLAATALAAPASAGSCPADQMLSQPRALVAPPDVGTSREVVGHVDLDGWRDVHGLSLRMRRLVVAVKGFVPLHWHDDRPSVVTVISGEIVEHSSFCAVPITHVAGDTTPEFGVGHSHWWENLTDEPVVLISTDVVPTENVLY